MLDFNEVVPVERAPHIDMDALKRALADSAKDWAPMLFPNAQRSSTELRLANIRGSAPRKNGSCVITLTGSSAGCWYDHSESNGGGPLDTVAQATGLRGADLLSRAAELANGHMIGHTAPSKPSYKRDSSGEIAFILRQSVPLAGTLAETYLASRFLHDPISPDLLFHPNLTDWAEKRGRPAMIGIIRDAEGKPTGGLHRTYLKDDGSGKADLPKSKMMLGPSAGTVRLVAMSEDGVLGIAEGIETALAASETYGVPVWAALSTSGMAEFEAPSECVRLIVYRDAGDAGGTAAEKAAMAARMRGIAVEIVSPLRGDDFADDLVKSASPATPDEQILNPGTIEYVSSMIMALEKGGDPMREIEVARAIAELRPDKSTENLLIDKLCKQTGMRKPTAAKLVKSHSKAVSAGSYLTDDDGRIVRCVHNAMIAIRSSEGWSGVIAWNLFDFKITVRGRLPWDLSDPEADRKWQDVMDINAASWLQQQGVFVTTQTAHEAVMALAHENPFHPVVEYLDSLEWDGESRIEQWLTMVFGCDADEYHKAVGSKILIAAVRRVRHPGCKFDCMMILEGEEGILKSTVTQTLFGSDRFTDQMPKDIGGAEASKALSGKWGIEFSEVHQILNSDPEEVLAFLSRQVDNYRPSYGRAFIDQPRQCVFFGTTNKTEYLRSEAGNRRFWPVLCRSEGSADIEWLLSNRDQIWAEASAAEATGHPIWIDSDTVKAVAKAAQAERLVEDSWDLAISKWLSQFRQTTVSEVLSGALSVPLADQGKASQMRVGVILKRLGWERGTKWADGKPFKVWSRQNNQ